MESASETAKLSIDELATRIEELKIRPRLKVLFDKYNELINDVFVQGGTFTVRDLLEARASIDDAQFIKDLQAQLSLGNLSSQSVTESSTEACRKLARWMQKWSDSQAKADTLLKLYANLA